MKLARRSFLGALLAIPFLRRFVPAPVEWQSRLWSVEPQTEPITWTPIVDASCPRDSVYFFHRDGVWVVNGSSAGKISAAIDQVRREYPL